MARVRALLVLLALSSSVSQLRAAGTDARSAAAAEALYREAKQLLVAGRAELACGKLEASQGLEPAIGTLLLLAHCYEQVGKSASAWATFRSAESLAGIKGQQERAEIARLRAEALEPRLSRLQLAAPRDADTRSWSLREDDRALSPAVLGVAIPVDPGPRRLEASAPGHAKWSALVTVPADGSVTIVPIPELVPEPPPPERNAPSFPEALPSRRAGDSAAPLADPGDGLRTLGYVTLGVGAAALVTGATYGLIAQRRYDASLDACRTESLCSPRGVVLRESAERHARVATLFALSGALLSAGGLVGWLLAPERAEPARPAPLSVAASVSEVGVGLEARGTF